MKYAADFRQIARDALQGKWFIAVVTGVIVTLLGGVMGDGPQVKLNIDMSSGVNLGLNVAGQTIFSTSKGFDFPFGLFLIGSAFYIAIVAVVFAALYFVLGSIIGVGYARFNLDIIDRMDVKIETIFAYFKDWKTTAYTRLLASLYTFLWSLLFIIPGIIASYSYAMTDYILAENPHLTAMEAIGRSKQMMEGNRFRLFCLEISFIGWGILCLFTFGIGYIWLRPYMNTAKAAFYREVARF